MVFSSVTFLCFFLPVVITLHTLFRSIKIRNILLVTASLFFYAWGEPIWVLLLMVSSTLDYVCARVMEAHPSSWKRKAARWVSLCGNIGVLIAFKYTGFIVANLNDAFGLGLPVPSFSLPLGISFYTFQTLSYSINVYKGRMKCQRNYIKYLAYVTMFPQLVAGPIVYYGDIAQSLDDRSVTAADIYRGFSRFIIGLSKKILLANLCGEAITLLPVSGGGQPLSFAGSWLLIVLFALQIFFDFSGYSDMAIGLGRMVGFDFLENFEYPYISKSISEFWRRWHMSLGAFFREYVYIPLGGNRVNRLRLVFNLMVVWALTGLWHGASWNFVVWGAYYGVLIILERLFLGSLLEKLPNIISTLWTLLLVLLGWSLFYYDSLSAGLHHIGAMLGITSVGVTDPATVFVFKENAVLLLVAVLCCLPWKKWFEKWFAGKFLSSDYILKPVILSVLLLISVSFLIGQSFNPFLYFRF